MNDRLSMLDTMFLDLEEADPGAHMHIGAALIFDPLPDGGAPAIEELRDQMAERLAIVPRFGQRLSDPHTSVLSWRSWESVGEVDATTHLRRATLPPRGGEAALMDWLGDFWSHRLDRSLPLWEMVLLEGLPEGRWAIVTKTHHCLVDGVGSLDIAYAMLDTQPEPAEHPAPENAPANGGETGGFWLSPGLILRGVRAGTDLLVHPGAAAEAARTAAAMTELLVREEIIAAPHCSLNGPITGTRRFAAVRFALDDIKAIKRALGGTVNDVVLALCAGGLRELLLSRGEQPPAKGLRAQIPVNVRSDDAEHALGNQLTSLFAELPVGEPDALARYEAVVARAEELKVSSQPVAGKGLVTLTDAMPPGFGALLGRLIFNDERAFNLTITNVPGPQQRFYAFGAPLREILPLVPLFNRHRVGIAAVSYAGQMVFGLNADRVNVRDLDVLAEGIEKTYRELSRAASSSPKPRSIPAHRKRKSGAVS